jgi:hypothetical protein
MRARLIYTVGNWWVGLALAARRQRRRDATSFPFHSTSLFTFAAPCRFAAEGQSYKQQKFAFVFWTSKEERSGSGSHDLPDFLLGFLRIFFYVFAGCNMKCSSSGFHASSSRSSVACSSPLICDVMLPCGSRWGKSDSDRHYSPPGQAQIMPPCGFVVALRGRDTGQVHAVRPRGPRAASASPFIS